MIEKELNIIRNSDLQNNIKEIAINLIRENIGYSYGTPNIYLNYEDTVKNLKILENEIINLGINDSLLTCIVFNVIKTHYDDDKELEKGLIQSFLEDDFFRLKLKFLNAPKTGILRFLKGLVPYVEKLYDNFNKEKYFDMLRCHEQIIEYALYYGVPKDIINDNQKLYQELSSKLPKYHQLKDIKTFRRTVNNREVLRENINDKNFTYYKTLTSEGYYIQKLLYEKMIENFDKTKSSFRVLTNSMNIYNISGLSIFTYRYDDTPRMILKDGNYEYDFNDREFWAKIFDMDFVRSKNVHYFNEETFETYKVVPKFYNNKKYKYYNNRVIILPNEYIDEGLNIARNKDYNNPNLFTGDGYFYFKDPTKVDDLILEKPNDYPYIALLKGKENKEAIKRSVASLKGAGTKNPKGKVPDWRHKR